MTAGQWVLLGWHVAVVLAYGVFCVCMVRKSDRINGGKS